MTSVLEEHREPGHQLVGDRPLSDAAGGVPAGTAIIDENAVVKGRIRNCSHMQIFGYVDGDLVAEMLTVHKGGKFYGTARVGSAEISGQVQGDIFVKHLISIAATGAVSGNVRYGQLAMEQGGDLSADVRNVPPELAGDLELLVTRGKSVQVTTMDLTALDPDNEAHELTFTVSNAFNGFVAFSAAPGRQIDRFTQLDLESGTVLFVHDGNTSNSAGFDVVARDTEGASSGPARTVSVVVRN